MAQKPVELGPLPEALGPYRHLRKLAVGGMGEVYLAEARGAGQFRKAVVIKAIRPDRVDEQEVVQAFLDEARIWALLTHPNIVPLYDCVKLEGRLCLVMEYIEGADLRELIQRAAEAKRPIPAAITVHLVAQIAAALHAAHEARGLDGESLGVVHRDVSPHNVLVDRAGSARLCDFGIARSALRLTRTKTGKFKGKFAYVSPEAIRGEEVDRRADVFGLGVLLYELLALRRPFQADGPVALLRTILDTDPTPIREIRREVSVRLSLVIERALAKEVSVRFPTAEAMRQALVETPEGQSALGVERLTEWFEGLTGLGGDWNTTQTRLMALAERSAARALDDDDDGSDEASFAEVAGNASVGERTAVELPAARGERLEFAEDEPTEQAVFDPSPSGRSSASSRGPGAVKPTDRGTERILPPTATHGPALFKDSDSEIPLGRRSSSRRMEAEDHTAATLHPRAASRVASAQTVAPASVDTPAPRRAAELWREYAPWVAGGLVAGGTLTWLLWKLS